MKIRYDRHLILVMLFFVLSLDVFHMWSSESAPIGAADVALVFELIYFLAVILRRKVNIVFGHKHAYFSGVVLASSILIFTSTFQAHHLYNQPYAMTFLNQRRWLGGIFSYFIFRYEFRKRGKDANKIGKYLFYTAVLCSSIYIVQHLLIRQVQFLSVHTTNMASSRPVRIYIQDLFIIFIYFVVLQQVLSQRNIRLIQIIYLAAIIYILLVVANFRLTLGSVLLSSALTMLTLRYKQSKKAKMIALGLVAGYFILTNSTVQTAIESFISGEDTMKIRGIGRAFYLSRLSEHPLLGGGYALYTWPSAYAYSGGYLKIWFNDNGIFGFSFLLGGIGFIWFLWFWIRNYKLAFNVYRETNNVFGLSFMFYMSATLINETHWFWQSGMYILAIYMAYIETVYEQRKRLK